MMKSTIYLLIGAGFQPSKVCLGGEGGGSVCVCLLVLMEFQSFFFFGTKHGDAW